jgi:hypothetical protein
MSAPENSPGVTFKQFMREATWVTVVVLVVSSFILWIGP